MEDVQDLFLGGLLIRKIGIGIALAYGIILFIWSGSKTDRKNLLKSLVPASLCIGTGMFFAIALSIAGIVASDFSRYFIVFHQIFFDNDLWILNPATDMLINIVPEPFFMDTALRIAVTFGCMVVAFLILCFFFWKRGRKNN